MSSNHNSHGTSAAKPLPTKMLYKSNERCCRGSTEIILNIKVTEFMPGCLAGYSNAPNFETTKQEKERKGERERERERVREREKRERD
jgi:hypothetical protein